MKLAQCVLPLLLSVRAVLAADPVLTDYFPPGTKVVFGLRVQSVVTSALGQGFTPQAKAASSDWLKMASLAGFDPFRDLDEVMIASTGESEKAPVVVVLLGRFDVARLAEGAKQYHGVPMLGGGKDAEYVMALLDGSTALAGSAALVRAAIDRRDGGDPGIDPALAARVASMRQRYDAWGLGDRPDGFFSPAPEANGLESVDKFEFGLSFGDGLELSAELHARSAEDAQKLNEAVQMVAAMVKSQQLSGGNAKVDIEWHDGTIKLAASIPAEELKKAMEVGKASEAMARTDVPADPAPALPVILSQPAAGASAPSAPVVSVPLRAPAVVAAVPTPSKPLSKAGAKTAASQVLDKDGDTLILRLPGQK